MYDCLEVSFIEYNENLQYIFLGVSPNKDNGTYFQVKRIELLIL